MSYLVFGLGLLLSSCGAYAIYFGYGIIAVERGWASVIAGAMALSCGVVTIALAFILRRLAKLQALLVAKNQLKPVKGKSGSGREESLPRLDDAPAVDAEQFAFPPSGDPWSSAPFSATHVGHLSEADQNASAPPAATAGLYRERAEAAPQPEFPDIAPSASPNISRASIEDVRRVVAERLKNASSTQARRASGAQEAAGALRGPLAEAAPERVFGGAAEPGRSVGAPIDEVDSPRPVEPTPLRRLGANAPEGGVAGTAPIAAPFIARAKIEEATSADQAPPAINALPRETYASPAETRAPPAETGAPVTVSEGDFLSVGPQFLRRQVSSDAASDAAAEPASSGPSLQDAGKPAIVGRYQSEGTSYVMYADGSIDAQSAAGAFHFESMAELKAFIEAQ
ncbi:hypothetical protein [Methylocapsa aurea]|uniref:hypothetical protein n=1 Tax=Methylocapsa aurea TaxID=663610 RepID=UPI00056824D6|nr:hypothetical protein [Methylocapsa aurea]